LTKIIHSYLSNSAYKPANKPTNKPRQKLNLLGKGNNTVAGYVH